MAADEDDALAQLRRFLSYLPGDVWEAPPLVACATDPPDRREEELLAIVPRDPRKPYKMRRILELGASTAARSSSSARASGAR